MKDALVICKVSVCGAMHLGLKVQVWWIPQRPSVPSVLWATHAHGPTLAL